MVSVEVVAAGDLRRCSIVFSQIEVESPVKAECEECRSGLFSESRFKMQEQLAASTLCPTVSVRLEVLLPLKIRRCHGLVSSCSIDKLVEWLDNFIAGNQSRS